MSNNNSHPLGKAPWFHVIVSTGLGSGFFPGAPGTFAGFIALVIWYALYLVLLPPTLFWVTFALIIITTFVGVWTSNVMEKYWGVDPRAVVIDEYVGTWIPLLVAPSEKIYITIRNNRLYLISHYRHFQTVRMSLDRSKRKRRMECNA